MEGAGRENSGAWHSLVSSLGRQTLPGELKCAHWAFERKETCRHEKEEPRTGKLGWGRTNVTNLMMAGIAA